MTKKLVLSGCSLAWGQELSSRDDRYGQLISNYYQCELLDVSRPGNCNSLISDYAVEQILNLLKNTDNSNIIALISWSFSDRFAIWNKNKSLFDIASRYLFKTNDEYGEKLRIKYLEDIFDMKLYYDIVDDLKYIRYNFIKEVINLQNFLKQNKIKYVFTFPSDPSFGLINHMDLVNPMYLEKRNYGFRMVDVNLLRSQIDRTPIVTSSFYNLVQRYNLPIGPENHPLSEAHELFSQRIIDHIETNRLFD